MNRVLEPEWLDELPPEDPQAMRSRQDLRRLNAIMGNAKLLNQAFRQHRPAPGRIVELGAGDGQFMLSLLRRLPTPPGHLVLVDRQPSIADTTYRALRTLGWSVDVIAADVFDWLGSAEVGDTLICNLFLHHLPSTALAELFAACAERTTCLLACEPARTSVAHTASRLVGFIGCNAVTRHDAAVSVRAGFRDDELSALWPKDEDWQLEERAAGLFSHLFTARRR